MAGLNVKFLKGTAEKYEQYKVDSLINSSTFYLIDNKDLYLGLIKLSNAEDIAAVESRVSLLEKNHSEYVKQNELQELINPLIEKTETIEEKVLLIESIVGNNEQGLVKDFNELKPLVLETKEVIETHSKLLEGIDSNLTVKSLIETSAVAADEAKQIAQSAKLEVISLSSNVYTKAEVDEIISSKTFSMSWQDMEIN